MTYQIEKNKFVSYAHFHKSSYIDSTEQLIVVSTDTSNDNHWINVYQISLHLLLYYHSLYRRIIGTMSSEMWLYLIIKPVVVY